MEMMFETISQTQVGVEVESPVLMRLLCVREHEIVDSRSSRTMRSFDSCPFWLLLFGLMGLSHLLAEGSDLPRAENVLFGLQDLNEKIIKDTKPSLVSVVRVRRKSPESQAVLLRGQLGRTNIRRGLGIDASWSPNDPNYVPSDFGSGVVISSDGRILTNYHVISDASEIWIYMHDGTSHSADIWAADPRSDLAVLRVSVENLKPIKMGSDSDAAPGHFVLVMGNPYAAARDGRASASFGIISNIARRPPPAKTANEATLHHSGTLLQTDVRLNYGTSGGVLLNLHGEMIGLTTSLAAIEGFDHAAGYAIPMNAMMRKVLALLLDGREVEYGFLGIGTADTDSDSIQGAMVQSTFPGTPAYQAGLVQGDVVTAVDGIRIRTREELIIRIGTRLAGSPITLDFLRDSKQRSVAIRLAKYPVRGDVYAVIRRESWRGISVEYVSVLLRELPSGEQRLRAVPDGGVLVTRVDSESPSGEAGLQPGTIVTHVADQPVRSPGEFLRAVKNVKGTVVLTTDSEKFAIDE